MSPLQWRPCSNGPVRSCRRGRFAARHLNLHPGQCRSAADGTEPPVEREGDAPLRGSRVYARHHVRQHVVWHRQSRDLGAKLDAICGKIKSEDDRREAPSSLLWGDVDHRRPLADPLLLGHRPVGDDVATGGAVLVMDRLQLRVHVGGRSPPRTAARSRELRGTCAPGSSPTVSSRTSRSWVSRSPSNWLAQPGPALLDVMTSRRQGRRRSAPVPRYLNFDTIQRAYLQDLWPGGQSSPVAQRPWQMPTVSRSRAIASAAT